MADTQTTAHRAKPSAQAAVPIRRIGIVGGGLMGSGIAESTVRSGFEVSVCELDGARCAATREAIVASLRQAEEKGWIEAEEVSRAEGALSFSTELDPLADADLVIEAITEEEDAKAALFGELQRIARPDAVLASNTSSIPIAQLAAATDSPERVLGLHFFSPVPAMSLVEVIRPIDADEEVVERALDFCRALGKHPIVIGDRSGFVVNMLLVPYLMAAVRMYEEGFASREDIDEAMKRGCRHPMGPLELCDFIGLDVLYAVCNSLFEEFKKPEYAPPPIMKRMVVSGHHGRKTGSGFYEYP